MKQLHSFCLIVAILAATCGQGLAATGEESGREGDSPAAEQNRAARVRLLAADVREIAGSALTSHAKKERRIATAVRVAVVAVTAYRHDADEVLGLALELTAAAARAAPAYAEVIAKAATFAPPLSHIAGAPGRIRATAMAAARGRRVEPVTGVAAAEATEEPPPARSRRRAAVSDGLEPVTPAATEEESPPDGQVRRAATGGAYPAAEASDYPPKMQQAVGSTRSPSSGLSLGENARLSVTTAVSVRHDDNVFLSNTNKTGDTIISATPGVEFKFGQQSVSNGSLSYAESFNRYTGKTAPNVSLGNGSGNFAFDDGGIAAALNATYQQFYQNNPDVLALGYNGLIRSNVFNAGGNVEAQLGTKMSVKVGADLNDNHYVTPGFVSSRYLDAPLTIFYKATPKVDLSLGYAFAVETPGNNGPKGHDSYYNLGARGNFTPKLSGTFSVGYQTRSVPDTPSQRLFAFSGAFDYAITPKSKATLTATRNFGASALGQSTKNSAYTLGLLTDLTPQWETGVNLSYQDNDFGAAVFNPFNPLAPELRRDHYWQSRLFVSYLYSQWLTTSASYNLRVNHSNIPGVEFDENILSLTVGLRY